MLQNRLNSKELTFDNTIHFVLLKYNSSLLYILYQLSRKVIFPIETNRKLKKNYLMFYWTWLTQPLVLVFLSDLVIKDKDWKCDRYKPRIFSIETNRKLQKLPIVVLYTLYDAALNLVLLSEFLIDSNVWKSDRYKLGSKTTKNLLKSLVFNSLVLNS